MSETQSVKYDAMVKGKCLHIYVKYVIRLQLAIDGRNLFVSTVEGFVSVWELPDGRDSSSDISLVPSDIFVFCDKFEVAEKVSHRLGFSRKEFLRAFTTCSKSQ